MFKNYIFDLYGTLIDIRTNEEKDELWEKVANFYGENNATYTPWELRQKYSDFCQEEKDKVKAAHPDWEYTEINLTNVFSKLYAFKNVNASEELCALTANKFRGYSTEFIKLYDGVTEFLEALKKKKRKVFLLSNAQRDFTMPEIKMLGLDKYFDDIIISSDVECRKPDHRIYEILFERNNLSKKDSIMIGNDFLSDIASAHDFGIASFYIEQQISPPVTGPIKSTWAIRNGNFKGIMPIILK